MGCYESHHLFVAPMYLDNHPEAKGFDPEERAAKLQATIMKNSRFKLKERRFSVKSPQDYSNYQYFFEDARKSIFWREGTRHQEEGALLFRLNVTDAPYHSESAEPIATFALRLFENHQGHLRVKQEIRMDLLDIEITLYQFDVGHVSFLCRYHMEPDMPEPDKAFYEHVLIINDRMRRLYIPWLDNRVGDHGVGEMEARKLAQLQGHGPYHEIRLMIHEPYGNFNPHCPGVLVEDYEACLSFETMDMENPNRPILLEAVLGQMDQQEMGCSFELLDDNRMFTLAFIQTQSIQGFLNQPSWGDMEQLRKNSRWYRLIMVDGVQETAMTNNASLREQGVWESTYTRWLDSENPDNSTLFGVTPHSFIMLGSCRNQYFCDHLQSSFIHQYSEMVRLVLGQVAAVHRFGRDIYSLSGRVMSPRKKIRSHGLDERVFREVSAFRQSFNDYINRLFFREVSPQVQGIELYRMVQGKLEIQEHLSELREEISQLFNHMEMLQRQSQEKSIHQLTQTSIVLGFLAVVTGIYGANFIAMDQGRMIVDSQSMMLFWLVIGGALIAASGMTIISGWIFALGEALRKLIRLD